MNSHLKTVVIPIAESLGIDVSKYVEQLASDHIIRRIDSFYKDESAQAVNVVNLPWTYSWEYKYDIMDDASVVTLLDENGAAVGDYTVRALAVPETEKTGTAVPRLKRRLVLVGKGLVSLYCDGELKGVNLSHLNIMTRG